MATSGVYTYNATIQNIVDRALRMNAVLANGQSATGNNWLIAKHSLEAMMKRWQAEGIKFWTIINDYQSLTASSTCTNGGKFYRCILGHTAAATSEPGTGATWEIYWKEEGSAGAAWVIGTAYTSIHEVSPNVYAMGIQNVWIKDGDTENEPLTLISKEEYDKISDKYNTGLPSYAYFDYAITKKVYLYPMPDSADYIVCMSIVRKLQDASAVGFNAEFPVHWIDALVYGLADNLADEFGKLPLGERNRLSAKALKYKEDARKADQPAVNSSSEKICSSAYSWRGK